MKMDKVFICSPYRGNVEANLKVAREMGRLAAMCNMVPIIPHLVFPQFLKDDEPKERVLGIQLGCELLKDCDELWIVGNKITDGMRYEIEAAKKLKKRICCFDVSGYRIPPDTLAIDDRSSPELVEILKDAKMD